MQYDPSNLKTKRKMQKMFTNRNGSTRCCTYEIKIAGSKSRMIGEWLYDDVPIRYESPQLEELRDRGSCS